MKTSFNVLYKVSLWEMYLFVFFKEEFKFFGRYFIKYDDTSWPNIPWPSHTPINNVECSSFKFLYMKKLSWLCFGIPGPEKPTWLNVSILYIFFINFDFFLKFGTLELFGNVFDKGDISVSGFCFVKLFINLELLLFGVR
jgi:hypothetical protein